MIKIITLIVFSLIVGTFGSINPAKRAMDGVGSGNPTGTSGMAWGYMPMGPDPNAIMKNAMDMIKNINDRIKEENKQQECVPTNVTTEHVKLGGQNITMTKTLCKINGTDQTYEKTTMTSSSDGSNSGSSSTSTSSTGSTSGSSKSYNSDASPGSSSTSSTGPPNSGAMAASSGGSGYASSVATAGSGGAMASAVGK